MAAESIARFWERLRESQQVVDAKRRDDSLYAFQMAVYKKRFSSKWAPTNVAIPPHKYPSTVIEDWSAAWKVRHFWEDQTLKRTEQGKVTY